MSSAFDSSRSNLPRPRSRWKTILLVLLVFVSGTVIGAAAATIVIVHRVQYAVHHPDEIPARLTARLTRRLSLTTGQSAQVERLIAQRVDHLKVIRQQFEPKFRSELRGLHGDVRAVLTPEQQAKWDKLFDDLTRNWLPAPTAETSDTQPTTAPATAW
jgi:hypothetical protein